MAAVILDGRSLSPASVEKAAFGAKVEIDKKMRPLLQLPARLAPVHARLRAISRLVDDDRPQGREIERIAAELVKSGELATIDLLCLGEHRATQRDVGERQAAMPEQDRLAVVLTSGLQASDDLGEFARHRRLHNDCGDALAPPTEQQRPAY